MKTDSQKYHSTYTFKMVIFSLFLVVLFLILLWLCRNVGIFATAFNSKDYDNKVTVVIDAGHGGIDTGASGIYGKNESILCLEISKKIEKYLSVYGIEVVMSRKDDNMLTSENRKLSRKQADLSGRVELTEKYDNPIFVSIHMNTFPSEKCVGTQMFYSQNVPESQLLADILKKEILSIQPDNKRANKSAGSNIYVLNNLKVPAVLIECGFLTNPEEEKNLNDPEYQKKLAMCISNGIIEFIKDG